MFFWRDNQLVHSHIGPLHYCTVTSTKLLIDWIKNPVAMAVKKDLTFRLFSSSISSLTWSQLINIILYYVVILNLIIILNIGILITCFLAATIFVCPLALPPSTVATVAIATSSNRHRDQDKDDFFILEIIVSVCTCWDFCQRWDLIFFYCPNRRFYGALEWSISPLRWYTPPWWSNYTTSHTISVFITWISVVRWIKPDYKF